MGIVWGPFAVAPGEPGGAPRPLPDNLRCLGSVVQTLMTETSRLEAECCSVTGQLGLGLTGHLGRRVLFHVLAHDALLDRPQVLVLAAQHLRGPMTVQLADFLAGWISGTYTNTDDLFFDWL